MSARQVVAGASDFTGPLRDTGTPLEAATLGALDRLQQVLTPQPTGADRFRADNEAGRFGRIFGGQLVAQAMAAAAATVDGPSPHSIHAAFLRAGDCDAPLDIVVDRTRDGRSMSIRHVEVRQAGHTLLTATVSFDSNPEDGPENHLATTEFNDAPESHPLLQHWVRQAPPGLAERGMTWIDTPPPLELRIAEPPIFLGGGRGPGERTHWMRLPRSIDGGPVTDAVLLAYATDYLLVDMALRSHPQCVGYGTHTGLTLDHAVWLHRPVRFDRWHAYTQQTVAVGGHRALVRGSIVDSAGRHVASTAQEVLIRPTGGTPPRKAADQ
ncbi:acyl-CoA thioesterase domain-containing protein [Mycolicibacter sp. MYC123]|uniref:Acyl-CoA thioesterase domain-containing protein n=1 Tax=[Mycobacterium] zoologicum TaxID=2872311 RepID=A0ABU5YIN0_9MYCO|nr:acyl-CoA thioesterase domain-containing protein [Mycolicibacter sp. MYC123]MEB3049911.1 acyl-CoA thioesterase domain-containing protein [Mycolicibacter sp. MYC123]